MTTHIRGRDPARAPARAGKPKAGETTRTAMPPSMHAWMEYRMIEFSDAMRRPWPRGAKA